MTPPRIRLLAAAITAIAVGIGGFQAQRAPQTGGWWHGVTGSLSPAYAITGLAAGTLVWLLGGVARVDAFGWMSLAFLPFITALTGFGAPFLLFSRFTVILGFAVLLGVTSRDLVGRVSTLATSTVFLICFGFFVLVGRFIPGPAGPQGDEPHYLLIAESLLKDGDVDLMNQFESRAFSTFTGAALEPHTAPRSPKDRLYAIHTPGLSLLIAPGFALAGFSGARAVVSLIMAGVVALLFMAARSMLGSETAAFVFIAGTFASPLPIYANALFPDSVATLAVAATLAALVAATARLEALATLSIALLPWLHPRFLPLAALLATALAFHPGLGWRRLAIFFGPLGVSVAALMAHFQSLFGSMALSAAYGPSFSSDVSIARIPWGAAALALDRQFGLLLFSPLVLLGFPGLLAWWKQNRWMAALLLAVVLALMGTGGAFSMWWGGASAPARFLIGAIPALVLIAAARWREGMTRPDIRAVLAAACGFGFGLVILACLAPRALHNRADGGSGLLRLLSPVLDLDRFFPGFFPRGGTGWMALGWGLGLIVLMLRPRLGALGLLVPLGIGALGTEQPLLDPFAASLKAVESWNDHRRTLGGRDDPGAFELRIPLGPTSWELSPGVIRTSPRFSLPRGSWALDVESESEETPEASNLARISIVDDDGTAAISAWVRTGEKHSFERFELPEHERRLRVRGEGLQSATRILTIRLTPRSLGR